MFNINLATASGVREVITRYGLQAKKKLGQHFLIDGHVLGKIISAAEIGPGDFVLEIGPGIGGMTQALAAVAGHVLAVELDKQLVPVLRLMFAEEKVTVVQGDILRLDLHQELLENKLISGAILTPRQSFALQNFATPLGKGVTPPSQANNLVGGAIKVVANLPYYITTPVIFRLLESGLPFESITVMIQKEVAARMGASPGTKDYGSLTLAVQYHADVELVANVPTNCFMPRPAVDSAVVKLKLLEKPRVDADKTQLFDVIHAAFGKRRKTLLNALDSEGFGGGKSELSATLQQIGIDPRARGETLDIFQFAKLARALS